MKRRFFCIVLALVIQGPAAAQPERYRFEHLTEADGLRSVMVASVAQDRLGFIWIGSWDGVTRYDGRTFTPFKSVPGDSTSLAGKDGRFVMADQSGTIWISTAGRGLNRFDSETGTFTRFDERHGLPPSRFHQIVQDTAGTLWAGGEGGLVRFDPETNRFEGIRLDALGPHSLPPVNVVGLYADREGGVWVTMIVLQENGPAQRVLMRRDPASGRFARFPADSSDALFALLQGVRAVVQGRDGAFWIGTSRGLVRLELPGRAYRHYPNASTPCEGRIHALVEGPDGGIWMMVETELCRFDPGGGRYEHLAYDPEDPFSVLPPGTRGGLEGWLFLDRQGVLWVPRRGHGVSRIDLASSAFRLYRQVPGEPDGLRSSDVLSIHEDRNGQLWVGTRSLEGGLSRTDRATGRTVYFDSDWQFDAPWPRQRRSRLLSHPFVWAIAESADGTLWFGTAMPGNEGGLNRYDPATGFFTRYWHDPQNANSLPENRIQHMQVDRHGLLWIATWNGSLVRFDPAREVFHRFEGLPPVSTLMEDAGGTLWVGTREEQGGGLLRFDPEAQAFMRVGGGAGEEAPLRGSITALHRQGDRLWVGTDAGLYRVDPASGGVQAVYTTLRSDLPDDEIVSILEDDAGHLWITTGHGLARFDPETETFRTYGMDRGLQGMAFMRGAGHGAAFRSARGELFFGGAGGLNAFFPDRVRDNPHPPQVALTDFWVASTPVAPGLGSPLKSRIEVADEVRLAPDQKTFTFAFAALHFGHPARNRYAFRLEGYDAVWRYVGTQHTATYTNLAPGTYTFRVKAASRDGVWSDGTTAVRVTVLPPWWRTGWAYGLYALLLVGAVFAANRAQRRRLIRRERAKAELREKDLRTEAAEHLANFLRAENRRQTQELEQARRLQLSMLPEHVPDHPTAEIAAFMKTATEVGGDYYDFDLADDGTLTLIIGDATGHGVPAGTMVTATKGILGVLARERDLEQVLEAASRAVRRMHLPRLYMALGLARWRGHTLELAGAGMPPALVYRAATGRVEEVALKGMPLGSPGAFRYRTCRVTLAAGDTLVLMSDGLPELRGTSGERIGYERMPALLAGAGGQAPAEVIRHLVEAARAWSDGRPPEDDMTLVVMRVKES